MDNDCTCNEIQIVKSLNEIIRKDNQIISLYERWINLKNNHGSVFRFMQNNDFKKVAIYGMGSLGRSLCVELAQEGIDVVYIIEQDIKRRDGKYLFYTMQDELPDVDVIIITPITFFDEIAEELTKKVKCPLLSLDDIVP